MKENIGVGKDIHKFGTTRNYRRRALKRKDLRLRQENSVYDEMGRVTDDSVEMQQATKCKKRS
jgi:hypothetical protein